MSLRPAGANVVRSIRKILFVKHIWLPRRHRIATVNESKQMRTEELSATVPTNDQQATTRASPCGTDRTGSRLVNVGCLNAQSVRNKSAILLDVLQQHQLQILALSETWHLDSEDITIRRITPSGYKCLDVARPRPSSGSVKRGNIAHGGVAIIYRDNMHVRRITFDVIPTTFEIVAATVSTANVNHVFVLIYRPGSAAVDERFYSEFTAVLEALAVYRSPVVITGDFNIHVDDRECPHTKKFLTLLESFGLRQSVMGPTHTAGHTLDLVITRSDLASPSVTVDPPQLSDHSLLRFQLSIPRPPLQYVDISTRSWKGFNADRFRDDLLSSTLCQPDSYTDLSVDQLQEMYDTTLPLLLDKHAKFILGGESQ